MEGVVDPLGLVGTTIADKYAVERVVGQGGFATVYRATHLLWKRPVAVKVFTALGEVAANQRDKLLEDFIQEGALLADLSERTTAICQARDVGMLTTPRGETAPYMVLEWLDGRALEDVLTEERANGTALRSLEQAVRLLDPVADALALAHKKGIAHRDVKPANVFVLREPGAAEAGVKLLDFGIAKVVQDAQKMGFGKTAGHITSFTPLYGAPEQFNRSYGATGPWTDVFALSLVVSEIVSGREPMLGDDLVQLAYVAADPKRRPTPRALGVATTDEVEAVFLRAVAVKPADRFQTVGEFWGALRTVVFGGDPLSSRPAPRSASPPSPAAVDVSATTLQPSQVTAAAALVSPIRAAPLSQAKSKAPIFLGVALVALVGAGAIALRFRAGGDRPSQGLASASPSASASAKPVVAAPSAPTCPSGMAYVPGGEFFMGSEEKDALPFERPPHKVKLGAYCLDRYEVTVAEFKACSDAGGCRRAGKENIWPGIKPPQQKIYDPLCNINDAERKAQHPINCVDWDHAREYCAHRGARLPTEAEWEFGARGSDSRIYPWGDDKPSASLLNACGKECVAWGKAHPDPEGAMAAMYPEDDGWPNTAPVGSFPKGKSRWGVEDMVGNVWEWVADWYAEYDPASKDAMAGDPKGPAAGKDRVIRGGAWNGSVQSWVRPSYRFYSAPSARSYGFGFRCAKDP